MSTIKNALRQPMSIKKRPLFFLLFALVAAVCVVLAFPPIQFQFLGAIRGEAFYKGKPTSYWSAALSGDPSIQERQVGQTLREGGSKAVPVLTELLADESLFVRGLALMFLEQTQGDISAAQFSLSDYLLAPDSLEFSRAMAVLKRIDEATARDVLIHCMHLESDPKKRIAAINAVPLFGPDDADVLANLESCMDDPELPVRVASAHEILLFPGRAIPALTALVRKESWPHRLAVVYSLLSIDPENQDAVKAVSELLTSSKLVSPGNTLSDRELVVIRLGDLGQSAHATIPLFLNALSDESLQFRSQAALTLTKIGHRDEKLIAVLIKLLHSDDLGVIQNACLALKMIGPAARMAIPELKKWIIEHRPNPRRIVTPGPWKNETDVATACMAALWSVEPDHEFSRKVLAEYLQNPQTESRPAAAAAIASIGASARELTPMVTEALKDESQPAVQALLREALNAMSK
jgi:HEAT repeat protein